MFGNYKFTTPSRRHCWVFENYYIWNKYKQNIASTRYECVLNGDDTYMFFSIVPELKTHHFNTYEHYTSILQPPFVTLTYEHNIPARIWSMDWSSSGLRTFSYDGSHWHGSEPILYLWSMY